MKNARKQSGGIGFVSSFCLAGFVYLIMPHLRIPFGIAASTKFILALTPLVYFILGFLKRRNGAPFLACQSFLAACGALFLILNYLPVTTFLAKPLLSSDSHPAAIKFAVVLGGGVREDGDPSGASIRRVVRAVRLYHEGRAEVLLFSTGVTSPGVVSEAVSMARFARSLGVPDKNILLEKESKNTDQNARNSAILLRKRKVNRVILVTEPTHMFRARESFLYYGIETDPAPTVKERYLSSEAGGGWNLFSRVVHEYLGIAFYRLSRFWKATNKAA